MRVAIYARVSTEGQETRGTIRSQVEVLRKRVADEGHELVEEYCDDGHSGARLDRPALDALRDAAEAGLFEAVWCLSPDRLSRKYLYQMLVLDELERHGVQVLFTDTPPVDGDPQAHLLLQMQGVIAEYERAKASERYRRGKLYRSRAGEIIFHKVAYGYRRVPRSADRPAHLVVCEEEAAIVRRVFDEYVNRGRSIHKIIKGLRADGIPSPTGRPVWGSGTISAMLRREVYVGRAYYNQTETVPSPISSGKMVGRWRPREEWIAIPVPAIIEERVFEGVARVRRDNSYFCRRNLREEHCLLRGLVKCGVCGVGMDSHRNRGKKGTDQHHYRCRHHNFLIAEARGRSRCTERSARADALDAFVWNHVCDALRRPDVLLAGERAVARRTPTPDDELLEKQLSQLQRKTQSVKTERRRLADLYQSGLLSVDEIQRRARELDARERSLEEQRRALLHEREELSQRNRLRDRLGAFARQVTAALDDFDFEQRQKLVRLVVEQVRVTGSNVEIHLRIPLGDDKPTRTPPKTPPEPARRPAARVSSQLRLRSARRGAVAPLTAR